MNTKQIIINEDFSDQVKDLFKVATGIGCGIILSILGGKLGKIAGQKLGSYIGKLAGEKVTTFIPGFASKVVTSLNPAIVNLASQYGKNVGSNVGTVTGKIGGAVGGYFGGKKAIQFFTDKQEEITDFYIMLIDKKTKKTFWLSSGNPEMVTANPNNAILIHKGQDGINSKSDLQKKLENDKTDKLFKDYQIVVCGINQNASDLPLQQGVISTTLKTAGKVISKALTKSAPKVAKVAKNPAVRKATTTASKKLIRSKAFRNFIKAMTKSKFYKVLKNKRFIQTVVKAGKISIYADSILTAYQMVSDYMKGNYKDISPQSAAAAAGTLYYISSPNQVTTGDYQLDQAIVKQGIDSIQNDLTKYKQWKQKQTNNKLQQSVKINTKSLLYEDSKFSKTYFNIILQAAQTDEQKLKVINKKSPELAKALTDASKSAGKTKINQQQVSKMKSMVNNKDVENLNKMKNANHKVSKQNINEILKHQEQTKSLFDQIFSKQTLMSLIPFSTAPTPKDIANAFKAMHAWAKGQYKFDQDDKAELISIGVDVGITTISLVAGGLAAFATFGVSMILAIIGCAATIGYVFDSLTRIGRNFEKRGVIATA